MRVDGMAITRRANPHARNLRHNATDAERAFWSRVRNRQLGGRKFRRQVSIGPYIVDFICIEAALIVELVGGQHTPEADTARTAFLEAKKFHLIRFWNNDVLANMEGVLSAVLAELDRVLKAAPPSPNPLPPAGEG
jgi:adenine-specific DNA-methyltransferase